MSGPFRNVVIRSTVETDMISVKNSTKKRRGLMFDDTSIKACILDE